LGDDNFLEKAYRQAAIKIFKPSTLNQLIRVICEEYGFKPSDLSRGARQRGPAEARAVIGLLAVEMGTDSLTGVGKRFSRDVVTLSEGVKRIRNKLTGDKLLAARIEDIRNSLNITNKRRLTRLFVSCFAHKIGRSPCAKQLTKNCPVHCLVMSFKRS